MTQFIASAVHCAEDAHPKTAECGYRIAWTINPHMREGTSDLARATAQHRALVMTVRALGARVREVPFVHGAFDSVFAKDNAIYMARGPRTYAVLASPRHAVRQQEQAARAADLQRSHVAVEALDAPFEGGDVCVMPRGRGALLGHGFRSQERSRHALAAALGTPVTALELCDPALYHLDTALAVLSDGTALVCDEAFTPASRRRLRQLRLRDVIAVSRGEALRFALNFVEVGDTVVSGTRSPEVEALLATRGKRVVTLALDEFQRAGGSAACLLGRVHEVACASMVTHATTAAMRSTSA